MSSLIGKRLSLTFIRSVKVRDAFTPGQALPLRRLLRVKVSH